MKFLYNKRINYRENIKKIKKLRINLIIIILNNKFVVMEAKIAVYFEYISIFSLRQSVIIRLGRKLIF